MYDVKRVLPLLQERSLVLYSGRIAFRGGDMGAGADEHARSHACAGGGVPCRYSLALTHLHDMHSSDCVCACISFSVLHLST